jgi:hypothetical protein
MQQAYVVQQEIEAELLRIFSNAPKWLDEDCHFAMRKYYCTAYYLKPQKRILSELLRANRINVQNATKTWRRALNMSSTGDVSTYLNLAIYVPSYPSRSICLNYEKTCAASLARTEMAAFVPNCNASVTKGQSNAFLWSSASAEGGDDDRDSDSFLLFPSVNQSVMILPRLLGTSKTIDVVTAPRKLSKNAIDTYGYVTACPTGFVVPDDKLHPRNNWIKGTGCAVACRSVIPLDSMPFFLSAFNFHCVVGGL